jgi:hypothetical protein
MILLSPLKVLQELRPIVKKKKWQTEIKRLDESIDFYWRIKYIRHTSHPPNYPQLLLKRQWYFNQLEHDTCQP